MPARGIPRWAGSCDRIAGVPHPEAAIHLVQLLLPVYDNEGAPFPPSAYAELRREMTERFGGLTAYTRAPAQGEWSESDGPVRHDDIVVFEVMADSLDRVYWTACRQRLQRALSQDEIVIRAQEMERL